MPVWSNTNVSESRRLWIYNVDYLLPVVCTIFAKQWLNTRLNYVQLKLYSIHNVNINRQIQLIDHIKSLASNIDKIDLPSQLASVLENRMLQHILVADLKVYVMCGWVKWRIY